MNLVEGHNLKLDPRQAVVVFAKLFSLPLYPGIDEVQITAIVETLAQALAA